MMQPDTARKHPVGLPKQIRDVNRTLVMGVVNVTPDSFSDGGQFSEAHNAIEHGLRLADLGADIVDVGGESTRPGAERISVDEELHRVIPVIEALSAHGVAVSIDTMRADVAVQACDAGAVLVNDVSGGKADAHMYQTVAKLKVPYVVMHWRGHSAEMTSLATYSDVVEDVSQELQVQCHHAIEAGIAPEHIVLDPGIGFAKSVNQNWPLLSNLDKLTELGFPMVVGVSRKKFLGELLAQNGVPRDVSQREHATTALTTVLAQHGVWAVRVHDVRAARDAIAVVERLTTS